MNIMNRISDAITQKPIILKVRGEAFKVYPATIGKLQVLSKYYAATEHYQGDDSDRILSLCNDDFMEACKILAVCTLDGKEDLLDDDKIRERAEFFRKYCTANDVATCILLAASDDAEAFITHFGIDVDIRDKDKIQSVKVDRHTRVFGGRSLWGALFDSACAKYGWTLDYVLWEISYVNLRMMLADSVSTVYLSDSDMKEIGKLPSQYADDPKNADDIIEKFSKITK